MNSIADDVPNARFTDYCYAGLLKVSREISGEEADKEGVMKAWRSTVPTISTQYMQQLKAVSCYYPTLVALKQAICDTLTWCCVQLGALSPSWQ